MKGQILDYNIQKNEGVISTDNARYVFSGSEWKAKSLPTRGMLVDFDVIENSAVGVYQALHHETTNTHGRKTKAAVTLWGLFLGGVGAHKVYMGSWGWGILFFLSQIVGWANAGGSTGVALIFWLAPSITALVEVVHLILMTDSEFDLKLVEFQKERSNPFSFFW